MRCATPNVNDRESASNKERGDIYIYISDSRMSFIARVSMEYLRGGLIFSKVRETLQ